MKWEINSERPVYLQLIEHIQSQIISGYYEAGGKLPSVRDLASEASVNPNTMQKALTELERQELIFTNRTTGKFITEDKKIISTLKSTIANNHITEFFDNMLKLGFSKEDIIDLINREQEMEGKK